jgi:MerR family transcriptional regulator/heat shock protein HspR
MRRKRETQEGKTKTYYYISSVSQRYNIHPQTLRLYEREGLIKPSRSEGNTRLYTDEDLRQLEIILNLVRDLGVNLAGVEVILHMRKKIEQIEAEVNEFLEFVQKEFESAHEDETKTKGHSLVPLTQRMIMKIEHPD